MSGFIGLSPILKQALGYEMQLPARAPKDIQQVLATCPGLEFILDGTERPIRRPQDKDRQRQNYSGKKKRHTRKNNVLSDKRTRKIRGLSPTVEGKCHDKKLADDQQLGLPSRAASCGKILAFKAMNPATFRPFSRPRNPKDVTCLPQNA